MMNEAEHARKIQELNRSNREFYEEADTINEKLIRLCPPEKLTADRILEFESEAADIVRRKLDFLASPLHAIQERLDKPIPKYTSSVKPAVCLALLQKGIETSDLEICRAVDAAGTLRTGNNANRKLGEEYKDEQKRRKLEVTISKVRRVLRDKGIQVKPS